MKYVNKVQEVLNQHALTQVELVKITKLSRGFINQTCRGRISPGLKQRDTLVSGINKLLEDRKIERVYTKEDLF